MNILGWVKYRLEEPHRYSNPERERERERVPQYKIEDRIIFLKSKIEKGCVC